MPRLSPPSGQGMAIELRRMPEFGLLSPPLSSEGREIPPDFLRALRPATGDVAGRSPLLLWRRGAGRGGLFSSPRSPRLLGRGGERRPLSSTGASVTGQGEPARDCRLNGGAKPGNGGSRFTARSQAMPDSWMFRGCRSKGFFLVAATPCSAALRWRRLRYRNEPP